MLRKMTLVFLVIFANPLMANICAVSNAVGMSDIGDGCSTNPSDGHPDYGYIFLNVGIFKSTFTPACNTHDKCYSTLGADYSQCDSNFLSDMRSRCYSQFNPLLRPEYPACMTTADMYYAGVSYYRSQHQDHMTNLQYEALGRSRAMEVSVDSDACGTTPERTTIYTTALLNQVNGAFQSAAGRKPTIYEFFDAMNAGDYVGDRAGWQAQLYTRAANAASVAPPAVGWWTNMPGTYGVTFAATPVISNATYFWRIPDQRTGSSFTLSYAPPMFNRTVTYSGFVKATVNGVSNMALVETSIVLEGTCAPKNGPYVNCN